MAAALRKFSLLAAGAAAWDDTMVLVQRLATDENWANNVTHMSRQDQLLSAGDTGSWCLTSMDSANGISGCWGTPAGQPCTRCVNGLVTCSHGTTPVLDYHGKTFCATADKRDSCFQKGCEPGGCCEQTCCPPQLKKDQSILIREHGDRKAKAAAAMLVAKEKDVKELQAEIKAEVAEMKVAKSMAPTAIPKERATRTSNMQKMQDDLKKKTGELKTIQAEAPSGLAKLKKYHQQQLKGMKGEIDHAKGELQKSLGNPFSMASEKQTELKAKTGEIQKLEYTYENEKKALKVHQADRAKQLKSLQATVEKRQAQVNRIRANPVAAQTNSRRLQVSQIKAIQDQINAKEAHLHALKDRQRQDLKDGGVKKLESELRAVKAKLMTARFGGQKQVVADLEAQADRLDQSYQKLKVSTAENKVAEATAVSDLQDEIYRMKAAAEHASHLGAARGQAQGLEQANAALKEAQAAYARAKEIVARAEEEDDAKLEGLLSQIAAKKGQRRQAAMNHRSPVHGEMETFIKNHEDAYKQAMHDFAKQEAETASHARGKVKALEGEIKTISKKLQKTAFGMAPALVKIATDQQSDIRHMAKDVAGKAAVLAAKEKELKTTKVQGKKVGMHKI